MQEIVLKQIDIQLNVSIEIQEFVLYPKTVNKQIKCIIFITWSFKFKKRNIKN